IDAVTKQAIKSGNGDPTIIDANGNDNNKKIWMTQANAKALGLLKADQSNSLDGLIFINPYASWDYDPSDGTAAGSYDFLSMAKQEIGHVLGFVSGVDAMNVITTTAFPGQVDEKALAFVSPMDLFRFSAESAKKGVFDITAGGNKYFSIDGGKTSLGEFSTGTLSAGGDGFQASHWKQSSTPLGVMDPDLRLGEQVNINDRDLKLLDVIGWDRRGSSFTIGGQGVDLSHVVDKWSEDLVSHRLTYLNQLNNQLSSQHPGYDFSRLLTQSAERRRIEFDLAAEGVYSNLQDKLAKEPDAKKIGEEIQKAAEKIWGLQKKFDQDLDKLAQDVLKTLEKADEEVEKWLGEKDPKKLAEKLTKATLVERAKFTEKIYELPVNSQERIRLETAILNAANLLSASDKPAEEVKKLLKSTGPVGDPVGWSRFWRPWLWFR
ncbi:MAG: NF038122 family metalloprotease, partial [Nodosilinea sp.]